MNRPLDFRALRSALCFVTLALAVVPADRTVRAAEAQPRPSLDPSPAVRTPYNSDSTKAAPLSATEAARLWKWPPGFAVSVFAAEPDVQQPIAMTLDDRGRLWVAEAYTYAEHRTGFAQDLRDRIVIFEDVDGDGRHDRRVVFADGLERLTSVELGFGGAWVMAPPNLYFIPDRDGDDRPDGPPEVRLDGFEWKVNHHTVANGLRWGPDGWLYGRHGIQAHSRIGRPGDPATNRVAMNVGIWRYHPLRRTFEVVAEGTTNPWGMDWNELGEPFFINTVIGHLWHVIPGAHYRRMYGNDDNPHVYQVLEQTADHVHWAAGEAWSDWRKLGTTSATSAAGGGHAHTGLMFYGGDNWPDGWRGRLLTINFNGKRLNVENVVRQGSGYVGHHQPDIGFTPDPFFRGIDLIYGPDGGVFISDWSDTGECHEDDGVHRLSGRIYKVTYGRPARPVISDVGRLAPGELLPLLDAKNEFFARHARRRFQELAASGPWPEEIGRALMARLEEGRATVARLRALWCLHSAGAATRDLLRALLADRDESVRAWAVRLLVESRNEIAADGATRKTFADLARTDPAAAVRLALASALQRLPTDQRVPIAQPLLGHAEDAADANLPLMLWYGVEGLADSHPLELAKLAASSALPGVRQFAARRLSESETLSDALAVLLRSASGPAVSEVLQGMLDAFEGQRQARPPGAWAEASPSLALNPDPAVQNRYRRLGIIFGDPKALEATRRVALDPAQISSARREALRALVEARAPSLRRTCEQLIAEPALTATAASGLAVENDPAVADLILRAYGQAPLPDRQALLGVLLSRPTWAARLLEAIGDGRLARSELTAVHVRQIRGLNQSALTARLSAVWGEWRESSTEKRTAISDWKARLAPDRVKTADRVNGRKIFASTCATCHVLNGEGNRIGPELTGANRDNLDYLLQNVIDPSSVVAKDYQLSTFTLADGRVLSGFVRSQNVRTITIQTVGEALTVPLTDIAERENSTLSMMPEGLLDALTESQALDLIAYLMDK